WISRLIASLLKKEERENGDQTRQNLFTADRIEDALAMVPKRVVESYEYQWHFKNWGRASKERLHQFFQHDPDFWVLRILGLGYLFYLFILSLGALGIEPINPAGRPIWPESVRSLLADTYANPVHGVHTFAKISMMVLLTFVAAFNRRIRWFPVLALLLGHVISTLVSFIFYFYGAGESFTLVSGLVDGLMVLIFLILLWRAHHAIGEAFYLIKGFPRSFSLAGLGQNILFYALTFLGATYLIFVLLCKYLGAKVAFFAQFKALYDLPEAMLVNTVAFLFTFTLIAYICARNRRLRRLMTQNISDPLRISILVAFIWFINNTIRGEASTLTAANTYLLIYFLVGTLLLLLIRVLNSLVYNVDFLITSLHPSEAATAGAATETFYGSEQVDTYEAIKKMDQYIANIRGRKRGFINFPFYILENILSPLLALRPRFSTMSPEERALFFKKYLLRTPAEVKRASVPLLADIALNIGLSIRSLCSLAHLTTPKGQKQVGYIPPDLRDRLQLLQVTQQSPYGNVVSPPDSPQASNNFHPEEKIKAQHIPSIALPANQSVYKIRQDYDYVIIGSGAAGAVMAYRLASTPGIDPSKILLVERGLRNNHRNDMSDDELEMLARLYKEGGLQQTKRFDMILLQGEALGGTTVINNAVCFEMTEASKQQWEADFDIDLSDLQQHYRQVQKEINIHPVDDLAINEKVRAKFRKGVEAYNKKYSSQLKKVDPVLVNARNEVGDGLWNLGNKRGRKLSMAE
ncbi:MAG: GMC family oxidoreductase N-terminal domain-containing protein, partial [Bacteroidota bacterium]